MAVAAVLAGVARQRRAGPRARAAALRRRVGIAASCRGARSRWRLFTSVAVERPRAGRHDLRPRRRAHQRDRHRARGQGAGRLTAASSTRGKYWREARPRLRGPARGGHRRRHLPGRPAAPPHRRERHRVTPTATSRRRSPTSGSWAWALSLLLLAPGCWRRRAARADPRRCPAPTARCRDAWDGDRVALVALALMAIVFGMQSAVDWTWFVPGPAAMALVAAGFVAGRGPARAGPDPDPAPAAPPARAASSPAPPRLLRRRRRCCSPRCSAPGRSGSPSRPNGPPPTGSAGHGQGDAEAALDETRVGRRREPAQRRGAARPGGDRDPGRQDRRRAARRSRRRC